MDQFINHNIKQVAGDNYPSRKQLIEKLKMKLLKNKKNKKDTSKKNDDIKPLEANKLKDMKNPLIFRTDIIDDQLHIVKSIE